MRPLTVRFESATVDELDEVARENDVDRSVAVREAVHFALEADGREVDDVDREADPDVDLSVAPEWATMRRRRERIKKSNRPTWWREGYRQRIKNLLDDAADGEIPPDGVDAILDGVRREVREVLFPDEPDRREEALEFIDDELDRYRSEWERVDLSPSTNYFSESDDVDETLAEARGVARALARQGVSGVSLVSSVERFGDGFPRAVARQAAIEVQSDGPVDEGGATADD